MVLNGRTSPQDYYLSPRAEREPLHSFRQGSGAFGFSQFVRRTKQPVLGRRPAPQTLRASTAARQQPAKPQQATITGAVASKHSASRRRGGQRLSTDTSAGSLRGSPRKDHGQLRRGPARPPRTGPDVRPAPPGVRASSRHLVEMGRPHGAHVARRRAARFARRPSGSSLDESRRRRGRDVDIPWRPRRRGCRADCPRGTKRARARVLERRDQQLG